MNILFIGDIFASPGRVLVGRYLQEIITEEKIQLAIANGENSAGGFGITPLIAEELFSLGLDVITSGNHIWDKKEIFDYLPRTPRLLRPANFPAELTSEKMAMGWYLDGRVSAMIGTHTHIPTADERILPGGTAYQTDVGMTGPY